MGKEKLGKTEKKRGKGYMQRFWQTIRELELLSHARQPEVSFLPFLYALMLPNCIAKFLYS